MSKDEKKIRRVKFSRQGVANGKTYRVGDVDDLPEEHARQVILAGRGVETRENIRLGKPKPKPAEDGKASN